MPACTHAFAELLIAATGHAEAKIGRKPLLWGQYRQGQWYKGSRHLLPAQRAKGPQYGKAPLPFHPTVWPNNFLLPAAEALIVIYLPVTSLKAFEKLKLAHTLP